MNPTIKFKEEVARNITGIGEDKAFISLSNVWNQYAIKHNYAHNFTWLGRPIIQVPQDVYAIQELIWSVKPDLIIETGIAHGGSLILSASMLALIDYCEAAASGDELKPASSRRRVLGIDIDIRSHNREAIEAHPISHMIEMYEGSSIDPALVEKVKERARDFKVIMVFLDSNHTHAHVLAELQAYAPLVSKDSYCIVWDSGIEDLPEGFVTNRPWGKGNNPKTAVFEYLNASSRDRLKTNPTTPLFEIDKVIEYKLGITASPDGFLRRL